MAPTPIDDNLLPNDETNLFADPTAAPKSEARYWTKANIAFTVVFALLALIIFVILLAFYLRRRSHKKKHANHKSDKAALLEDEDKTSMFSRDRHSSVTLYVDEESEARRKRASSDTISLIPLQITPVEDAHDPMETTAASNGSGVSAMSRLSTNTMSTMMLSPISPNEDGDLSVRPGGRPRSTSTASQRARYYESTPLDVERQPVPIIVTESH
ncbi:hypothetical protein HBH98_172920 [Parastagonospora nodorum]|nr:hypothetical protein HBI10_078590 [Parastagonospora nodorum]KAH4032074.1 hypothetical protein HBI13_019610 [Parastagonospora nodorum]KAH4039564.1 hypothetical protein HBI09_033650 [Parastagonospora nodorum]KAH4108383.1 hypothetical protein HBH46_041620 [Parastagonospora nodorum]KAH4234226.1 hypothetical protein HBI05_155260 [Parastagonospora nodorum]